MMDIKRLISTVAEAFNINEQSLMIKCRKREIVDAKTIIINYLPNDMTLLEIGKLLNLSHSAVIYHRHRYLDAYLYDAYFKEKVKEIQRQLQL